MPSDHISAFESICCRSPVCGEGSDSGELYSRLVDDDSEFEEVSEGK